MTETQSATSPRLCDADLERIIRGVVDALKIDCPRTFYSPPQVAKLLGVEPAKIIGWIRRGELRAVNIADRTGGRPRWRIEAAAFDEFKRRRESSPPVPKSKRRKNQPADLIEFF